MFTRFCSQCNDNPHFFSLDASQLDDVCVALAKPMKKAVRKTVEEAVFLLRNYIPPSLRPIINALI
jgi:hypothetical protein